MSHFISNRLSPFNWVKKNLFSNLFNTILTLISLLLISWISSALISWSFFQAQWGLLELICAYFLSDNILLLYYGELG